MKKTEWTKVPPKEIGWYWMKTPGMKQPVVVGMPIRYGVSPDTLWWPVKLEPPKEGTDA